MKLHRLNWTIDSNPSQKKWFFASSNDEASKKKTELKRKGFKPEHTTLEVDQRRVGLIKFLNSLSED